MSFPQYKHDSYASNPYIDLRGVPRENVTVTVAVEDDKLKREILAKLSSLKSSKEAAIKAEQWSLVYRLAMKINVVEEILSKAKVI
ncbi:hypothetical protein [Streptomyces sp. NPDC004682]